MIKILKAFKIKKLKLYILVLTCLIFIINITALLISYIDNKINNKIINKFENRIMYVVNNDNLDKYNKIKKLSYIENVYYNLEPFRVIYNGDQNLYFKHINPTIDLKIIYGKSKINSNEIIVPNTFFSNDYKEYIGHNIKININNSSIELKISGIYSSDNMSGEYIYVSNNSIINNFINEKNNYIVLINNKNNYDKVADELKKYNCKIESLDNTYMNESSTYKDINRFLKCFYVFNCIFFILLFASLLFYNIFENKYNIALLKTFGYSNNFIKNIFLLLFALILIISYLICSMGISVLSAILFQIFKIKDFLNFNIIITNFFVMYCIITLIIFLSLFKINKISIIKLLKN